MRILFTLAFILGLSAITTAQSPQRSPAEQNSLNQQIQSGTQEGPTRPCFISELPWNRRPLVTLQRALDLADSYIRQENIDLSNYYLLLAKPSPYASQAWLFRWARDEGKGEGYIEIAVSMEGEASRGQARNADTSNEKMSRTRNQRAFRKSVPSAPGASRIPDVFLGMVFLHLFQQLCRNVCHRRRRRG